MSNNCDSCDGEMPGVIDPVIRTRCYDCGGCCSGHNAGSIAPRLAALQRCKDAGQIRRDYQFKLPYADIPEVQHG